MRLPRFRLSAVLACLVAGALALILARDLAARHHPLPLVLTCALTAFVSIHHSLIPFTTTSTAHPRKDTHRG